MNVDDIMKKYGAKIETNIKTSQGGKEEYSSEYIRFKQEMVPEFTRYERLCKSFGSIIKGELGGYIEKEENLNQDGDAWVSGDAWVYGNARVSGDARVYGNAQVSGKAYFTLGWFIG